MVITLLGVYIVILGLMTLTLFQGDRCVRNINFKLRVFDCPLLFKYCMVAIYIKKITYQSYETSSVYTIFSDHNCTSREQQCRTVLTENVVFLFY